MFMVDFTLVTWQAFSYQISITITVWDKYKLLFTFIIILEITFISGCMRLYFYLEMFFLGSEFYRWLCNAPTNVTKIFWRHCKVWKNFRPIFYSIKCFDKSLGITLLDNVQKQYPGYVLEKNFFSKISLFLQENTCAGISSFIVHLQTAASERIIIIHVRMCS